MPFHDYRPDLMGTATLSDTAPTTAGAWTSYALTYTAGRFGIDDRGGIRIAWRTHCDMTNPQFDDPGAPGYTTVVASNGAPLDVTFDVRRHVRPWGKCLRVVCKRFLAPDDTIEVCIGDSSEGSAGVRAQTFCESAFQFRILADPFATGDFIALPEEASPRSAIAPGPAAKWVAQLPTLRDAGSTFALRVRAEDRWGNPTDAADAALTFESEGPISGLPATLHHAPGTFVSTIDGLHATAPGDIKVRVLADGETIAVSNPLRIRETSINHYWSDMHGQSGETIGTGTAREYFAFARNKSCVDIAGHQGNDFQITDAFWDDLNALTAEFDDPGRFLAIPGYEWSGNTGLGGDHNVWYRREGRPIYRSSRALIQDTTLPETDCHDVKDLFRALADEDVLVNAHVGGRFADVGYAHEARLEPSVEVHSSWGTFDWIVEDALKAGYRIGIVAASDGHKGRPGASYPSDAAFGSYGGLTCHLMPELTRDALFEAFRRRKHYATTGARLVLDVSAALAAEADVFVRDPSTGNAPSRRARVLQMGDIARVTDERAEFRADVLGSAPIEKVEIMDGLDVLHVARPFDTSDLGRRLRITVEGQEVRGRQRLVRWNGTARIEGASVARIAPINFWNPDHQPKLQADGTVTWTCPTTGGATAIDLWLDAWPGDGLVHVATNQGDMTLPLSEIGLEQRRKGLGGIGKAIAMQRLPDELTEHAMSLSHSAAIPETGDARIFARIYQQDGHRAWSSPIYMFR